MNHHSCSANPRRLVSAISRTSICSAALFFLAALAPAHAAPTTVKGSLDRLGVTTVGSGVADGTKYAGADLAANTKQADDYAKKYSKDYTLFSKYEITFEGATLDTSASTITFSMPTFKTLPIPLTKVTGDFAKSEFKRFEFEAQKWYPDLEKNYAIKNVSFKGFIDISDPAKPLVDITAVYEWQEVFKEGTLIQPLATLTYKTTAKDNPGLGEWAPVPPGPVANVPEPVSSTMLLAGLAVLASRVRRMDSKRASHGR